MKKTFLALCASLLLIATAARSGDSGPKDFVAFWKKLHNAIIKKDYNSISQFVEFPLVVELKKENGSVETVKPENFRDFFNRYLSREHEEISRYEELRAKKELSEEDLTLINDGSATIDDMEFQKIGGAWKLVYIYAE